MPLPAIAIRPGEPSDAPFMRELSREAFEEYSLDAARQTAAMAARAHSLVAWRGDQRIGFALVEVAGADAHLAAIAVRTSERGIGVGRDLLRAAETLARARGARELHLATADSNLAALPLFIRSGYLRRRHHSRYYARGQPAVEMYKAL